MSNLAIRAEGLSKRYTVGVGRTQHDTLRDQIMDAAGSLWRRRRRPSASGTNIETAGHIWALKDACFEVKHGEILGVIGRNGAGKSTLLKILSRITEPSEGFADLYGRVASLL